jgi:hypothetical protein
MTTLKFQVLVQVPDELAIELKSTNSDGSQHYSHELIAAEIGLTEVRDDCRVVKVEMR